MTADRKDKEICVNLSNEQKQAQNLAFYDLISQRSWRLYSLQKCPEGDEAKWWMKRYPDMYRTRNDVSVLSKVITRTNVCRINSYRKISFLSVLWYWIGLAVAGILINRDELRHGCCFQLYNKIWGPTSLA